MNNSLYNDILEFSKYEENMKLKQEGIQNNCQNPVANIMTDDGIYSMGMGAVPMMNYDPNSPIMGDYKESSPMMGGYQDTATPMDSYGASAMYPVESAVQQVPSLSKELPPDLADMVNSLLLESQDNYFNDFDQANLDVNIASASFDNDEEDNGLFGYDYGAPALAPQYEESMPLFNSPNPHSTSVQSELEHKRRKPRKTKTQAKAVIAEFVSEEANHIPSPEMVGGYEPINFINVASPASSSSGGFSDTCSVTQDEQPKKTRQRRPRVSYATLSEEEKYKRIRDLNNEASRVYRDKQRNTFIQLEQQLPELIRKNQNLKDKSAALEKMRDHLRKLSHQFLQMNMNQ